MTNNVVSIASIHEAAKQTAAEWAEPVSLPFSLLPVPECRSEMLPTRLGPWVEDIAERLCVPLDFTAIPAMVAAGAMIGSKVAIRPQERTLWSETANLFGCIVGSPGELKSPALNEVLRPLHHLNDRLAKAYRTQIDVYETHMSVHKLARDVAEKQARKSVLAGNILEAEGILGDVMEPTKPRQRRLIVTDATVEKLGEICADNGEGILMYRDELITFLSDLDHEEKAAARGFVMTGWTGDASYQFDRIMRGETRIETVNLSLLGTTQPDKLAKYIRQNLTSNNDGMVQRLQLLAWPDKASGWRNVDRFPDSVARQDAYECFDQLFELDGESVGGSRDAWNDESGRPYLRFEPEALERFVEYRGTLEKAVRGDELPPALSAHLSKYRGLVPRLALVCHLASGGTGPVSSKALDMALQWAAYLEQHARRAYGSLSVDNGRIARAIWRRIEKGDLSDGFTERDIYRKHWATLEKGPGLTDGLKLLVDCDWLASETIATMGRGRTVFHINPKAQGRLAAAA
jgi:hypothetical protein